mmetsp:Transcript_776/g.1231  ORF Transcript_776/g.1231 Transcript_776/m.1231 type:complete len:373 (-) Transcript_776:1732-2850(-)
MGRLALFVSALIGCAGVYYQLNRDISGHVYPLDTIGTIQLLYEGQLSIWRNQDRTTKFIKGLYSQRDPMKGKRVIITGATRGLGRGIAAHFAALGADLILPCRKVPKDLNKRLEQDAAKSRQIWGDGNTRGGKLTGTVTAFKFDLADLDSVESFIKDLQSSLGQESIDILVNNAGLQMPKLSHTKQGFEMTFGVNFLGPAFLTLQLLDNNMFSIKTQPRVISVSSEEHRSHKRLNATGFSFGRPWGSGILDTMDRYAHSKLAQTTFFVELAKRYPNVLVYDMCPGPVASEIASGLGPLSSVITRFMKLAFQTPSTAAIPIIQLATMVGHSGEHFHMSELRPPRTDVQDQSTRDKLWVDTLRLLENRTPPNSV